jgi:NitT/TauT family transport system substrate-binding protein
MKNRGLRKIALCMAIILIIDGLGGCSKSKKSAGGIIQESKEAVPSSLETVAFISPTALESFDNLPLYVGIKMGYFQSEGINLKLIEQTGTDDVKMIASGQAQFGYPSPGVMWSCIDAGITNVKAICNMNPTQMFGIAVRKDSGISTFADLKGKKIAIAVESWSALLAPLLKGAGMGLNDVTLVTYGTGRFEAVASGAAPALFTWLSEYGQLIGQGYKFNYLDGNTIAPQVSNSLCTSTDMINKEPDIVQHFINAFSKSMYFCYCNLDAAADITLLSCPSLDIGWSGAYGAAKGNLQGLFGITENDQKNRIAKGIGRFEMPMCQNTIDHLYESGAIKKEYTASDYYTNEFADKLSWDKSKIESDAAAYVCTSSQYKDAHQQ